jgi:hypothetical protein
MSLTINNMKVLPSNEKERKTQKYEESEERENKKT